MSDTTDAPEVAAPEVEPTEVATPESDPDADVIAADEEAAEADALAAALEARFVAGGTLEVGELEQAESLSRWARLKAARSRTIAARAAEARRLSAAHALAVEVANYSAEVGPELARLLAATGEADAAFRAAVEAHNQTLIGWKGRAKALDVPETQGYRVPAADEHGGIRLGRDGSTETIQSAGRIYSIVNGETLLSAFRDHPDDRAAILAQVEKSGEAAA